MSYKAKYTPGEWKASPVSSVVGSLITADGISVATALPRMTVEEVEANAALIAAAPDLLETLREVCGWIAGDAARVLQGGNVSTGDLQRSFDLANKAHAAIAKATGQEAA